jgi:alkyl hydroperoxide reductase subunit AhpC
LQQHEQALNELGTRIVVVTFERVAVAQRYANETEIRWPVLVDTTRALYRAYGMQRGRAWDIWGPRSWWAYAKEAVRGRFPRRPTDDTAQLGGDVLVDPHGAVRLLHVGAGPADRPSMDVILRVRRSLG